MRLRKPVGKMFSDMSDNKKDFPIEEIQRNNGIRFSPLCRYQQCGADYVSNQHAAETGHHSARRKQAN